MVINNVEVVGFCSIALCCCSLFMTIERDRSVRPVNEATSNFVPDLCLFPKSMLILQESKSTLTPNKRKNR